MPRVAKYRNKKTGRHASRKEAIRSGELRTLAAHGIIRDLREQVRFELIPAQYAVVDGKRKCVERAVTYTADFTYTRMRPFGFVVEDVKSKATRTQQYVIRRKLMRHVHGIAIEET
jgi:hypothetical protein